MSLTTAGRGPGRRYNFATHGNSEQGARQGDHLIKNNAASSWSPGFGGGPTTVRFFPAKDPTDPTGTAWDPYRLPTDVPNSFGDWIRRYMAVRSFGEPGITMIIGDPSASADGISVDHFMSPAWVLYHAVHSAIKARNEGRGWAALTQGSPGRGAALSKPTDLYVAQCCIMQHKGKVYQVPYGFAPDHKPIVFAMSSSAGQALLAALNQLKDGIANAPVCATAAECEAVYANGDPISLDYGRFVSFYKKGEDPRQGQQPAAAAGWDIQAMQQQQAQNQDKGFDCFMTPTFGPVPANLRAYEQVVASKVRRWEDILYFPTVEEQATIIANQFPADMIAYAWRDHPEWIPEFVRERLSHAVHASVPAGVPAGVTGWPTPPVQSAPSWGAPPQAPLSAPTFAPPLVAPAPPGYAPPVPSQPTGYAPPTPQMLLPASSQQPPTQQLPPPQPPPMAWGAAGNAAAPAAASAAAPGWPQPPVAAAARPHGPLADPAFAAGSGMPSQAAPHAQPAPAVPPMLQPDPFAARPQQPVQTGYQQPQQPYVAPATQAFTPPPAPPGYYPPQPPAPPGYYPPQAPPSAVQSPAAPPMQPGYQPQQPPQLAPQQAQQPQQPPQQPPAQTSMSRGQAALMAAQAAGGMPPQ